MEHFLLPDHSRDPELSRRARLIIGFGVLGFVFGMIFAGFYVVIGHYWGTAIILVCSFGFLSAPFLLKSTGSLRFAGNLLSGIMTAGFSALCTVEGGVEGHAIAWLVSVPLCALLLVGKRGAQQWTFVCFLAGGAIITANLSGISFPVTYDRVWHPLVTATGYLGLIGFMFLLGLIFESGRERAFTKMKEALAKLEASNEQLVHLNEEKTEFLGIAAHDLKNPLTAVIGSAELITILKEPEQITKMARNISAAGIRMRNLITDLLDANAIEQGRFTSKIERCDVAALVRESVEHNQLNASRKEIALRVQAADSCWARVDAQATVHILDTVISNAVKYSPHQTEVTIRAGSDRSRVFVSITDQGPGLSPEDQKKLFQKFSRLSAKPTGGESSTGLGLSIVKRLAQAMSGTVECESIAGAGATFSVRLPAWEE
ncbi:MAG: sensor histidine kinase [Verrucomicrobiota bacterium]